MFIAEDRPEPPETLARRSSASLARASGSSASSASQTPASIAKSGRTTLSPARASSAARAVPTDRDRTIAAYASTSHCSNRRAAAATAAGVLFGPSGSLSVTRTSALRCRRSSSTPPFVLAAQPRHPRDGQDQGRTRPVRARYSRPRRPRRRARRTSSGPPGSEPPPPEGSLGVISQHRSTPTTLPHTTSMTHSTESADSDDGRASIVRQRSRPPKTGCPEAGSPASRRVRFADCSSTSSAIVDEGTAWSGPAAVEAARGLRTLRGPNPRDPRNRRTQARARVRSRHGHRPPLRRQLRAPSASGTHALASVGTSTAGRQAAHLRSRSRRAGRHHARHPRAWPRPEERRPRPPRRCLRDHGNAPKVQLHRTRWVVRADALAWTARQIAVRCDHPAGLEPDSVDKLGAFGDDLDGTACVRYPYECQLADVSDVLNPSR